MEPTTRTRLKDLIQFVKSFNEEFNKQIDEQYVYQTTKDMFNLKRLASGIEGTVFDASFKEPVLFHKKVAIKDVNLVSQKNKQISKQIIKIESENLYQLFLSSASFNKPSLTELINHTLINQLVLQKICPNFSFNYYWEHHNFIIRTYNEFVNGGDFYDWAQKPHTYHEWCNALFQIMVGLTSIKRYFNMLHTDFHTKNILVYKIKKGGYWTYTINGFKYYLPNLGYQFLIHDFGFAWIPNKLTINWHYSNTLRHLTKSGENFYDIASLLREILSTKSFRVPTNFKQFIDTNFLPEDVNYTLSKSYYRLYAKPAQLAKYPNVTKTYNGSGMKLIDKIYQIFHHNPNGYDLSRRIKGPRIESYSLDKSFDKTKLPRSFRSFVITRN